MGRGSSKAGAGGGGNTSAQSFQPTSQELAATSRRNSKNRADDLNDEYTFEMRQMSDGYHSDGTETTPEENMVNGLVATGAHLDPNDSSFRYYVNGYANQEGISARSASNALSTAAQTFRTYAQNTTGGVSTYYSDMALFADMMNRRYRRK